jgi:hypothetical protein
MKFCQKLGVTQIKVWFNRFKDGRMSAHSDQRSERLSMSRNADGIDKARTTLFDHLKNY